MSKREANSPSSSSSQSSSAPAPGKRDAAAPSLFSQIAAKVGVTPAAVTLAMQDSASISADTKQRVFWASRKLGYRQSRAKHRQLLNIAAIVGVSDAHGTLQGSKDVEIWEGLSACTEDHEMSLHTYIMPPPEPRLEFKNLPVLIRRDQIDGVVVLGRSFTPLLEFLRKAKIPTVVASNVDLEVPVDQVRLNVGQGSRTLVQKLIAMGHRRIGFITNGSGTPVHQHIYAGYESVLKENNCFDPRLVRMWPGSDMQGISPGIELINEKPTAILAPTAKAAHHVAFAACFARVPFTDGFVIGTCGHEGPQDVIYPTVHLNTNAAKAGAKAFDRLMELHKNYKQEPQSLTVDSTIEVYPSTYQK